MNRSVVSRISIIIVALSLAACASVPPKTPAEPEKVTQTDETGSGPVTSVDDAAAAAADGWAKISWSKLGLGGEATLARTGVTVRCLQRADGTVPDSDDEPDLVAFVARSY